MMKTAIFIFLIFISQFCIAQKLPLEIFAKQAQYKSIKLSPDGKHFAATVPMANKTSLVIITKENMQLKSSFSFAENEHIGKFYWATNQRLVYTKRYKTSSRELKWSKGELFAANIDGSNILQLIGSTATRSRNPNKKALNASARIAHLLPKEPNYIVVSVKRFGNDYDDPFKLFKININTKERILITKSPLGNMKITVNDHGEPTFAKGKNRQGETKRYFYQKNAWQELTDSHELKDYSLLPQTSDPTKAYIKKSVNGKTNGLYLYDFKTKQTQLLFNHPIVDIDEYIKEPGTNNIIAVKTMLDGVQYHYIVKTSEFAKHHQQLTAAFPKSDVRIYANSLADKEYIVKVRSDKSPSVYYLFNKEKQSVKYLLSSKNWINPQQMRPRTLISFKTRDNQTLYGYLTLPEGNNAAFSLIVDVHGGPFGSQDKWHYDSDAQMWANNGYAVLQINFRGSGGYGRAFEKSAYLKRSTLIQQDIIDGTRWAQSLEKISDTKVCIIGGSCGGYAALMASLIEPDLYQCAIARYGAYDLLYQMTHADYMSKDSVSIGAMKKYGDNENIWRKESPLTYIDKLKTPLMIVTGGKDKRVPPQNALNLKAALDERNIDYQWLYRAKEGHGFVRLENKIELYKKSLAFAEKYLR